MVLCSDNIKRHLREMVRVQLNGLGTYYVMRIQKIRNIYKRMQRRYSKIISQVIKLRLHLLVIYNLMFTEKFGAVLQRMDTEQNCIAVKTNDFAFS